MRVAEAIRARRSIHYFDPEHRLAEAEFQQLMQLALHSPTAFNIQNWRFLRVRDPALRHAIRQTAWDQPQVTDASALLILCFDQRAWDKDPARYWRDAPPEIAAQLVPEIRQFYAADEQLQRDEGMRSCGIAAQTLMLAAQAMGMESCAMDGFDFARVAELIQLPADHRISLMLAIGKALKPAHARPGSLELADVLLDNRFPETRD